MAKCIVFVFVVSVALVVSQEPQSQPQAQPISAALPGKASPSANANQVQIVTEESEVLPDGKFRWLFELSDGTKVEQNGEPKQGENGTVIVVSGSSTWTDPEGKIHTLTYTADENGYQPQGEDVPPIPDAIARSLSENAQASQTGPGAAQSRLGGGQPLQAAPVAGAPAQPVQAAPVAV